MSNVSKGGGGGYLFRILDIMLWVMLVRGGDWPLQNPRYIVMSNVSKGGTDLFRILDILLWVMLVRGGGGGYLFRILDIMLWVMLVRGGGGRVPLQNPRYHVMRWTTTWHFTRDLRDTGHGTSVTRDTWLVRDVQVPGDWPLQNPRFWSLLFKILDILLWVMLVRGGGGTDLFRILDSEASSSKS